MCPRLLRKARQFLKKSQMLKFHIRNDVITRLRVYQGRERTDGTDLRCVKNRLLLFIFLGKRHSPARDVRFLNISHIFAKATRIDTP